MEPPGRRESETKISFREFIGWTFENNRTKFHAFTSRNVQLHCVQLLKLVKLGPKPHIFEFTHLH